MWRNDPHRRRGAMHASTRARCQRTTSVQPHGAGPSQQPCGGSIGQCAPQGSRACQARTRRRADWRWGEGCSGAGQAGQLSCVGREDGRARMVGKDARRGGGCRKSAAAMPERLLCRRVEWTEAECLSAPHRRPTPSRQPLGWRPAGRGPSFCFAFFAICLDICIASGGRGQPQPPRLHMHALQTLLSACTTAYHVAADSRRCAPPGPQRRHLTA